MSFWTWAPQALGAGVLIIAIVMYFWRQRELWVVFMWIPFALGFFLVTGGEVPMASLERGTEMHMVSVNEGGKLTFYVMMMTKEGKEVPAFPRDTAKFHFEQFDLIVERQAEIMRKRHNLLLIGPTPLPLIPLWVQPDPLEFEVALRPRQSGVAFQPRKVRLGAAAPTKVQPCPSPDVEPHDCFFIGFPYPARDTALELQIDGIVVNGNPHVPPPTVHLQAKSFFEYSPWSRRMDL